MRTEIPGGHPMAVKVYSASGSIEPHRGRSAAAFMSKGKPRRRKRKPQAGEPYRGPRKMGQY